MRMPISISISLIITSHLLYVMGIKLSYQQWLVPADGEPKKKALKGNMFILCSTAREWQNQTKSISEELSSGGSHRTRTCNPLIKSQMLYQLS